MPRPGEAMLRSPRSTLARGSKVKFPKPLWTKVHLGRSRVPADNFLARIFRRWAMRQAYRASVLCEGRKWIRPCCVI